MPRRSSVFTTSPSRPLRFAILLLAAAAGASPAPAWAGSPLIELLDANALEGKYAFETGLMALPEIDRRIRRLMKLDSWKISVGLQVQGPMVLERIKGSDFLVLGGNKEHASFDLRAVVAFDLRQDKVCVGTREGAAVVTRYFEYLGGRVVRGQRAVFPFEQELSDWWRLLGLKK